MESVGEPCVGRPAPRSHVIALIIQFDGQKTGDARHEN